MGSKLNPSPFDCIGDVAVDEPVFTLRASDPTFAKYVRLWAEERANDVAEGRQPAMDALKVQSAHKTALEGEAWRARKIKEHEDAHSA